MKKCLKTPKEAKKGRNKTYDILEIFASNEEINRIGLVKSKLKQSYIRKNKIILP